MFAIVLPAPVLYSAHVLTTCGSEILKLCSVIIVPTPTGRLALERLEQSRNELEDQEELLETLRKRLFDEKARMSELQLVMQACGAW